MSFDGVPRPSQLQSYGDPIGAYIGANQAADQSRRKPRIGKARESLSVDPVHKELEQYAQEDDEEQETLSEEEREQLLVFAKLRGLMNFSLENGVLYRFSVNEASGLVDLIDDRTGNAVLTLTVEELLQVSDRMQRYAGRITDRLI